ncbi:MAG: hypothetical protein IPK19_37815 [Chloroflexi bacterium]|nr:hypothetical protein [Chloroflexota bacterium]
MPLLFSKASLNRAKQLFLGKGLRQIVVGPEVHAVRIERLSAFALRKMKGTEANCGSN